MSTRYEHLRANVRVWETYLFIGAFIVGAIATAYFATTTFNGETTLVVNGVETKHSTRTMSYTLMATTVALLLVAFLMYYFLLQDARMIREGVKKNDMVARVRAAEGQRGGGLLNPF